MEAPHDVWVNNPPLLMLMTAFEVMSYWEVHLGSLRDTAQSINYCWC